ncbi:MAG: cyclase family protein [Armatimonadota bacterium]
MRIVDISRPLRAGEDIACEVPANLPLYEGLACEEYRHEFRSHTGCYFETSAHLFRGGTMTSDVPLESLFLPAILVRLAPGRRGGISAQELSAAVSENALRGRALIVDTGGREGRHFERDCARLLAQRGAALLAASLDLYDTGFDNPTGVFVDLFRAEIPILAGIQNLEAIEHDRVFLMALPLLIERVCTAPCRAVVLDGEPWEVQLLVKLLRPDTAVGE